MLKKDFCGPIYEGRKVDKFKKGLLIHAVT